MDMIGHNHPRMEMVPFAIEMKESLGDNLRYFGLAQVALPHSLIQCRFDAIPALDVGGGFGKVTEFRLPPVQQVLRQAVVQTKNQVLRTITWIPVRQVTARVPPASGLLGPTGCRRSE